MESLANVFKPHVLSAQFKKSSFVLKMNLDYQDRLRREFSYRVIVLFLANISNGIVNVIKIHDKDAGPA